VRYLEVIAGLDTLRVRRVIPDDLTTGVKMVEAVLTTLLIEAGPLLQALNMMSPLFEQQKVIITIK
jgi:hypothetical protein